jgi:hypothetical protein
MDDSSVLDAVLFTCSGRTENQDGLWTWETLSPVDTFSGLARSVPEDEWAKLDQQVFDNFSLMLAARRPVEVLVNMRNESYLLASLATILIFSLYGFSLLFCLTSPHEHVVRS